MLGPDRIVGWRRGDLVGDVRAGVRRADDEHGAVAQLLRPAIRAGVQLPDRRVEVRRERRDARVAEGAGRDRPRCRPPSVAPRRSRGSARRGARARPPRRRIRPGARSARRTPPGSRPSRRTTGTCGRARGSASRQPIHARGRVQPQRRPAATPAVSDARLRVQDHVLAAATSEVVARREPGLAAAHDHGLDVPAGAGVDAPRRARGHWSIVSLVIVGLLAARISAGRVCARRKPTLGAARSARHREFSPGEQAVLHREQRRARARRDADLRVGVLDVVVGRLRPRRRARGRPAWSAGRARAAARPRPRARSAPPVARHGAPDGRPRRAPPPPHRRRGGPPALGGELALRPVRRRATGGAGAARDIAW